MTKITEAVKQDEGLAKTGFSVLPERTKPLGPEGYRTSTHGWVMSCALLAVLGICLFFLFRDGTSTMAMVTVSVLLTIITGGITYALFGQKTTIHKVISALTRSIGGKD